jgi:hypothetical protein
VTITANTDHRYLLDLLDPDRTGKLAGITPEVVDAAITQLGLDGLSDDEIAASLGIRQSDYLGHQLACRAFDADSQIADPQAYAQLLEVTR